MDRKFLLKFSPLLLILVIVAVATGNYWIVQSQQNLSVSQILSQPPTKAMTLTGDGQNHTASALHIQPGFYDVELLSGQIENFPMLGITQLTSGQNILINKLDQIRLSDKAQLKLTPSKIEKLSVLEFSQPAFYIVGKQIDAGRYKVSYSGNWLPFTEKNLGTQVTLINLDDKENPIRDKNAQAALSLRDFAEYQKINSFPEISLKNNSLLEISFVNGTPASKIILTKIK